MFIYVGLRIYNISVEYFSVIILFRLIFAKKCIKRLKRYFLLDDQVSRFLSIGSVFLRILIVSHFGACIWHFIGQKMIN